MSRSVVRSIWILTLLLLSAVAAPANEADRPSISWDRACPIDWSLFQGTPPADASHRTEAAAIHMTIRWHASYSVSSSTGTSWNGEVSAITVSNTMEPTLSWAVPGKMLPSVLQHEQLHFDLNEVYRRKLECLLLSTGTCNGSTQQGAVDLLNATLHQTATATLEKLSEMQSLYDSQTAHGSNGSEQARWEALISSWLDEPTTAP